LIVLPHIRVARHAALISFGRMPGHQGIEQIKMFRDALEAAGLLARERSRAT
jgi:hypothetical protein